MKTKIVTTEVTTCLLCPFYRFNLEWCIRHQVHFSPLKSNNIAMTDNIPMFCSLPDKEDL